MKYVTLFENYNQVGMLDILRSRIPKVKLMEYLNDNDAIDDDDQDYWLEEYLYDTHTIRVNTDYSAIEIYDLDNSTKNIIGDLPVVLYHFTSSTLQDSISENGLIPAYHKTNTHLNSYSGVYLTSQTTGAAVDGYKNIATQVHGGDPIMVAVKMYIRELSVDKDDSGLSSGAYQFITGKIAPERILYIEDGW
jgi:hypothetical protein